MQASPREQQRKPDKQVQEPIGGRKRKDRGFQEAPIFPVGYQDGKERFAAQQKHGVKAPKINIWRNNLTACSQHHNLYFVACLDWIYVYKPEFPHQTLPARPHIKWQLPVLKDGMPGHMTSNQTQEHSVNNVLVGDLGNEEVILFACGNGDVIAYYTSVLVNGAKGTGDQTLDLPFESANGRRPKPFFNQNVNVSAWGLAVHTEARLIAVSSNSHNITVFAPALHGGQKTRETAESALQNRRGFFNANCSRYSLLQHRDFNRRRILKGHNANIPSISFYNSPGGSTGCYLASTDINGVTIIWNVDTGKSVRMLGPMRRPSDDDLPYGEEDRSQYGWGVIFLDPRGFSRTLSIVRATGTCVRVKHDLNTKSPQQSLSVYDISESQSMVRNAASWSIYQKLPISGRSSEHSSLIEDIDESIDNEDEYEEEEMNYSDTPPARFENIGNSERASLLQRNISGIIPEDPLGPGITQQDLMDHRWSIFSYYSSQCPNTPKSSLPQTPLVFLNPRKIHLLQSPDLNLRERGSDPYPVVYLEDPLAQQVPASLNSRLQNFDRMNLYTQIPELGILLVGSPKGRVAVLTLHLLEPTRDPDTGQLETDVKEPMYTMRLDHLLPLKEQEAQNQRPLQPLIGIAASPVFGMESRRPRYRILLSYLNHTVLAYEIGREDSGAGGFGDVFTF